MQHKLHDIAWKCILTGDILDTLRFKAMLKLLWQVCVWFFGLPPCVRCCEAVVGHCFHNFPFMLAVVQATCGFFLLLFPHFTVPFSALPFSLLTFSETHDFSFNPLFSSPCNSFQSYLKYFGLANVSWDETVGGGSGECWELSSVWGGGGDFMKMAWQLQVTNQ